jgi:tRNA(adenine34) deaminase
MSTAESSVDDERFMREALREAELAAALGEVPVGCVLVLGGEVIARGRNLREAARDPSAHAELVALRAAAARLRSWRLLDVTCYATLEPCPMCAGALVNARIARLVYGCDDPKAGAVRTLYSIGQDPRLNHRFELSAGVLADECAAQLSGFFAELRARR